MSITRPVRRRLLDRAAEREIVDDCLRRWTSASPDVMLLVMVERMGEFAAVERGRLARMERRPW